MIIFFELEKGIGKISQNNLKNKQKFSIENVLFFIFVRTSTVLAVTLNLSLSY